jgi:L-cysteine S-thiosulfotransferase
MKARAVRRAALVLLLALCAAADGKRSGYDDASPETRAMQDDDSVNPGFLWVQQGEAMWRQQSGTGGKSCADCHGDPSSMRGVAARMPEYDPSLHRPITLEQRVNQCRTERQGAPKLAQDSDALLAITALIGLQSRGMKVNVNVEGPMSPFFAAGQALYTTRFGQLNLSCHQCHDELAGRHLGGSLIPQGHANGYPLYRLEWQSMGSLYRRIRNCMTGVRAEPFPPEAPELVDLEIYLGWRARGLAVETPAVRP